ncbi:DNA translocase FtsK, partial [Vibrio parahaemolyticus]|nr:DNA translocase FtsK [Vibrio parahaemolyticus]
FLEAGEQDCVVAVVRKEGNLIMILDFEKIIADINPELSMEKYDVKGDKSVDLNQRMVGKRNAKTIMVVDDSAFIRSLIQDTLASSGYNVITCKDGGEAHEKLMSLIEVAKEENLPVPEEPLPTLELLYHPEKRENFIDRDALEQVARLVESKLADYKIKADVVGIYPGPVITRFELDLAPGVKVSRISGLSTDLARALSAMAVRVVEVIP